MRRRSFPQVPVNVAVMGAVPGARIAALRQNRKMATATRIQAEQRNRQRGNCGLLLLLVLLATTSWLLPLLAIAVGTSIVILLPVILVVSVLMIAAAIVRMIARNWNRP